MPRQKEGYIHVVGWDKFQHYGADRNVIFIKNYTSLLAHREYLDLSPIERSLLHAIWLVYAASGLDVSTSVSYLRRVCGLPMVRQRHIDSLVSAGFIEVSASKPLATYKKKKERKELLPTVVGDKPPETTKKAKPRTPKSGPLNDEVGRWVVGKMGPPPSGRFGKQVGAAKALRELLAAAGHTNGTCTAELDRAWNHLDSTWQPPYKVSVPSLINNWAATQTAPKSSGLPYLPDPNYYIPEATA